MLITLVILTLISIYLTEFLFETNLETQAIHNFQASFKARTAAKSLFKAMLIALTHDEDQIFLGMDQIFALAGIKASKLNPPKPVPLPAGTFPDMPDVVVFTPYLRPVDHLYNLNRVMSKRGTTEPASVNDRKNFNQFINILKQIPLPNEEPQSELEALYTQEVTEYLTEEQIYPLYGAIFDWMDTKEKSSIIYEDPNLGQIGFEESIYPDDVLEVGIKNRRMDKLTELRLIPGIMDAGIAYEDWKRHFTIFDVGVKSETGTVDPRINVNLAEQEDIVFFLRQFDQNTYYNANYTQEIDQSVQFYVDNATEIAELLTAVNEDGQRMHDFKDSQGIHNVIDSAQSFDKPPFKAQDFFITHSQWYEVILIAEVQNIQARVEAIVYVPRDKDGKADSKKVEIVKYELR